MPSSSSSTRGACNPTALHGRGSSHGSSVAQRSDAARSGQGRQFPGPLMKPVEAMLQPLPRSPREFEHMHETVSRKNVPGTKASDIRIHSTWHAMSRQVLQSQTKFSKFFYAMLSKPRDECRSSSTASPWPMPLPYHFGKQSSPVDGKEMAFQKAINLQVGYLNYLHMNKPCRPPPWICGKRKLNDVQWAVISRLRKLSEAWNRLDVICADDMGRVAAKQERQEEILQHLSKIAMSAAVEVKKYHRVHSSASVSRPVPDQGKVIGRMSKGDVSGAQVIIADRIKMEGKPCFDPLPFLDHESAKLYKFPFSCNIDPDSFVDRPPKVRVHADWNEKVKLLQLLEKTGRLGFCKASEVHAGFGNGMFCVPKSTKVDRLILDGRPANLLQKPPNKFIMTMASPSAILGIYLQPSQKLLMSGDDLSNFFYTFKVNSARVARNFLDWKIPISLAKRFSSFPDELRDQSYVYPCLASLAMGDSAACEYAQTSHIAIALQCGALEPEHLLTLHGRAPRSDFCGGIIIDDFCLLEKVPMSSTSSSQTVDRRCRMHGMYDKVGLEAHPGKGFTEEESASFWGADIDGRVGLVRGNLVRAASLVWVATRVATLGICSIALLEILAGGFVSLFGFRRRMMSLLDYVYSLQGGRDRRDIILLPPDAIDELWSLAILCPLAVSDLRAGFSDFMFMVDASNWGDAVVAAPLENGLRAEVHRHSVNRSCWTKLLTPYKAYLKQKGMLEKDAELPGDQEPFSEHPIWEVAARGLQYEVRWKHKAKAGRHINAGELRSFIKAEELAAGPLGDVRVPIGSDSQVSLGAICKGRSASPCLNAILQQSLPNMIGLGIYSSGGYVRSAHNPADDPTRGVRVREPDVLCPSWWQEAGVGNFEALDRFLFGENLHPIQLGGYPALNELMISDIGKFDKAVGSKNNLRHRAVHERLRLRAKQKSEATQEALSENCGSVTARSTAFLNQACMTILGRYHEQILLGPGCPWPPTDAGFLDIYSGRKGFAKACLRYGAQWVLCVDINDGAQFDVLNPTTKRDLEFLISQGVFEHVSAAPVCGSFSRAITPAVRSKQHPQGAPWVGGKMRTKIQMDNQHSAWVVKVVKLCVSMGILFWVENPFGSLLWAQPEWDELQPTLHDRCFRVDFCRYGTPWRKRSRFFVGEMHPLSGLKNFCEGSHQHVLLRGRAKGEPACMTKLAQPYPRKLCGQLAHSVCLKLGRFKGPQSLTCRCSHRRIGEAKNPGPRTRSNQPEAKDPADLDRVELVRPETMAIGQKHWEKFLEWAYSSLGKMAFYDIWKVPGLMVSFLAAYGKHWYGCGGALFNLRHLYIYAQKVHPVLRGQMQPAWDVISRWQELEPVHHRRPLPVALLHSMVIVAVRWNWIRVAAVLLLTFYGCCRPGEVLSAQRKSLVLPEDLGAESGSACFLRILKPKLGRRGMGRVQHVKISDPKISHFLSLTLGSLHGAEMLHPGSAGAFRTRWDRLLRALGVPRTANLTPGSLRAGGTVELYKQGMPIMDILWALRLKNIETLQHYLQEISTEITMVDLPSSTRNLVKNLNLLFPHFLSIFSCETGEVHHAR